MNNANSQSAEIDNDRGHRLVNILTYSYVALCRINIGWILGAGVGVVLKCEPTPGCRCPTRNLRRSTTSRGADPQIFLCIFVYALISYQSSMGDESVCSDAVKDRHTYLPGCAEMTVLGKQENDFLPLSKHAKYVHRNHCVSLEAGKAV